MNKYSLYIIIYTCLYAVNLWAQHPYYYNISTDDGLPSNEVYELLQDSFGYVWMGCDAGLFRYDGFKFKQYSTAEQKGRSLSSLVLDKKGAVWCQNFNGQIFKVSGDSLKVVLDLSHKATQVPGFCFDHQGYAWSCNEQVLYCHNLEGELVDTVKLNTRAKNIFRAIAYRNQQLYLYSRTGGIFSYSIKDKIIKRFEFPDSIVRKGSARFFERGEELYAFVAATSTENIGYFYQLDTAKLQLKLLHQLPLSEFINMVAVMKDRRLWLLGDFGAQAFENVYQMASPPELSFFNKIRFSDVLIDREGNYWFSSLEKGIFVIPSLNILQYNNQVNKAQTRLHTDKFNRLWMGSAKGVISYLTTNDSLKQPQGAVAANLRSTKDFEEKEDTLWAFAGTGININLKSEVATCKDFGSMRDVLVDGDRFFSVSYSRAALLGRVGGNWKPGKIIARQGGWSLAKVQDENRVWLALSNGVHYYENDSLHLFTIRNTPVSAGILEAGSELLWIGSLNKGVYGLQGLEVKYHFSTQNGLKSNEVKTMKADGDWLWFTAGDDLYRIHLPSQKISNFTRNLGINAKDIEDLEIRNSRLYMASHKGLMSIPVELKAENDIAPMIKIVEVVLGDSLLSFEDQKIILPNRHAQLKIKFTATAFRSRGNYSYEYRITELDSSWIRQPAENNFAPFTALTPGSYTFEVRAVNESGVMSPKTAILSFQVRAPFWQQWWMIVLMVLGGLGIVLLVNQLRWKIISKRLMLEKQLSSSQLTALKAQMNPHFMYNALNSIQEMMLTNDFKNANLYLSKFSNLMRTVLNTSGADEVDLEEELKLLKLYLDLEKLRFGSSFEYWMELKNIDHPEDYSIVSMIIQPFVENAVKHGLLHKKGDKKVELIFEETDQGLSCIIRDNGVGRKKSAEIQSRSKKHASFATSATVKRLEILNAIYKEQPIGLKIIDLYHPETQQALGTEVQLMLPLRKND